MKIRIVQKKYHKNGIASAESDDGSGEAVITLTTTMMRYWKHHPIHGWTHIKRTLLHELAHIQVPRSGHSEKWKARAIALGASRYWTGPQMIQKDIKPKSRPWMNGRKVPRYEYGPWLVNNIPCGCQTIGGKRFPSRSCGESVHSRSMTRKP